MYGPQVIATALRYLVQFINILILVRIVVQFFNVDHSNPIIQFIYNTTEPILAPVRNLINNIFGYSGFLDFSPIIAMFLIEMVYKIIIRML